ncbi:hypothetical protein [Kordiimonas aquimaris]|uniref:hypothetical protein n=1 Tax=Kordiimonas aquimaris TaxID=707591 RepID=UPI0021D1E429|nr:hypothetical protein [Kordiimonas aquimaris]
MPNNATLVAILDKDGGEETYAVVNIKTLTGPDHLLEIILLAGMDKKDDEESFPVGVDCEAEIMIQALADDASGKSVTCTVWQFFGAGKLPKKLMEKKVSVPNGLSAGKDTVTFTT